METVPIDLTHVPPCARCGRWHLAKGTGTHQGRCAAGAAFGSRGDILKVCDCPGYVALH